MAINFEKTLEQLIKGGIGVVNDELLYKDSEGNTKDARGFDTVGEIPESLDPGQIVLVTDPLAYGLWRGLKEGETELDSGAALPLKFYKEITFNPRWLDGEIDTFALLRSDFGGNGFSFTKQTTGVWRIVNSDPIFDFFDQEDMEIHTLQPIRDGELNRLLFASSPVKVSDSIVSFSTRDISDDQVDPDGGAGGGASEGILSFRFFPPQPE